MGVDDRKQMVILRFLRLTSDDIVEWKSTSPPEVLASGSNDMFPECFSTSYRSQQVFVLKRRFPCNDEFGTPAWGETVEFVLVDMRGRLVLQTLEPVDMLESLLHTVREQAMDVSSVLDDLLADGDEGNFPATDASPPSAGSVRDSVSASESSRN